MISMIVKGAGILLIMAGSGLLGVELEKSIKLQCELLRELEREMIILGREMGFSRTPLQVLLEEMAGRSQTRMRNVYLEVIEQVKERNGMSLEQIWAVSVKKNVKEMSSNIEIQKLILQISAVFVCIDPNLQNALLEKQKEQLKAFAEAEEQKCREKGRLYKTLTVSGGVFLVILLL